MKIERKITFEERELNALKVITNVDCSFIDCSECPLKLNADGVDDKCLSLAIRKLLDEQHIDY